MSYQVLARKWRPQVLDDVVGQAHVLTTLSNALNQGRLHHAYLFCGTRGIGKTTLARLLAKCMNCETKISSEPCNTCHSCQAMNHGNAVDVIEIDAASRTKVENIRELLDNVPYAPSYARFKIYLIDEVHMLSTHSFNALLKTLEEPPEHVKFIFATTEPHKLPATIISRCLRFNLKAISEHNLVATLARILDKENIGYEESALPILAQAAHGSLRDALSLLEQAIGYSSGSITQNTVCELLGFVDRNLLLQLLSHIASQNPKKSMAIVEQIDEMGVDFTQVLQSILQILHEISIQQFLPKSSSDNDDALFSQIVMQLSQENTQLLYQIALMGQKDLNLAPSLLVGFEMLVLRMIAFQPNEKNSISTPPEPKQAMAKLQAPIRQAHTKPASRSEPKPEPKLPPHSGKDLPQNGTVAPTSSAVLDKSAAALPTIDTAQWLQTVQALNLTGISDMIISHCALSTLDGSEINLLLDPVKGNLLTDTIQSRIEKALSTYWQKPMKLKITIASSTSEYTPAAQKQQKKQAQHEQAMQQAKDNANVQNLIEHFDGQIVAATLIPKEASA